MHNDFAQAFRDKVRGPEGLVNDLVGTPNKPVTNFNSLVGHSIWLHHGQSQLLPKKNNTAFWVQLKIVDISDPYITVEYTGADNKLSTIEGIQNTATLNAQTLTDREDSADDNQLHIMPTFSGNPGDMITHKQAMIQAGILDEESAAVFDTMELRDDGLYLQDGDDDKVIHLAAA
jgi:hypothetical protein